MSPILLQQILAYGALAVFILGALSALCTGLGPLIDKLATPGSKMDHVGKGLTGVGVDLAKVKQFAMLVMGKAPGVAQEIQALESALPSAKVPPEAPHA